MAEPGLGAEAWSSHTPRSQGQSARWWALTGVPWLGHCGAKRTKDISKSNQVPRG